MLIQLNSLVHGPKLKQIKYVNQHKFVHYLHLVGAHHKFVGA
jgi:hypothetical protein